jgi:hypothetical protein
MIGGRMEGLVMTDCDSERHIGEIMAEVLRERLMELETLEATGAATEDTVGRLDYVRKLLVRFDKRDSGPGLGRPE